VGLLSKHLTVWICPKNRGSFPYCKNKPGSTTDSRVGELTCSSHRSASVGSWKFLVAFILFVMAVGVPMWRRVDEMDMMESTQAYLCGERAFKAGGERAAI